MRAYSIVAPVVMLLVMCVFVPAHANQVCEQQISRLLPAPNLVPSALAHDGTVLWLAQGGSAILYRLDPADGFVLGNLDLSAICSTVSGVGWDGTDLWVTDGATPQSKLYKVDRSTGQRLQTLNLPGRSATGISFGGGALWVVLWSDTLVPRIHKLNPATGASLASFPLPVKFGGFVMGAAYQNGALWLAMARNGGVLWKLDPQSGEIINAIHTPQYGIEHAIGGLVAASDNELWVGLHTVMSNAADVRGMVCLLDSSTPPQTGNFTLTVKNDLPNSGTVTLNPPGGSYPAGTKVTITATPVTGGGLSGIKFDYDDPVPHGTQTTTLTMFRDKVVVPMFYPRGADQPVLAHTLKVDKLGAGAGAVSVSQQGATLPGFPYYQAGTQLTLTAVPAIGCRFAGWSGDLTGNVTPAVFSMDAAKNIVARFEPIERNWRGTWVTPSTGFTYELNFDVDASGKVYGSFNPPGGKSTLGLSGKLQLTAGSNAVTGTLSFNGALVFDAQSDVTQTTPGKNGKLYRLNGQFVAPALGSAGLDVLDVSGDMPLAQPQSNRAPVIVSAPTALPNPATVGAQVSFAAAATDADGDALAYAWSFGDGASAAGASVTHVYSAAGTYAASVIVSDGHAGSVIGSLSVVIQPTSGSGGGDGDGGDGGGGGGGGGVNGDQVVDLGSASVGQRYRARLQLPAALKTLRRMSATLSAGTLPAGLRLNRDTLRGKLTTPGSYTFTVTFSGFARELDSNGRKIQVEKIAQVQYRLTVVE